MIVKKKIILFSLSFFFVALYIQGAFALTANSSNYSIRMFGTGMATGTPSSANHTSTFLSEAKGTTRNAEGDSYTVNVGFFNNTAPYQTVSITSYSISPTSAVVGSTISLYISALNPESVWAVITAPNSQEQTVTLVNNEFVVYNPPSVIGTYTVVFYANSSMGAIASVIDSFELTQQSSSSGGGSSGGGRSTTTIIEGCTSLWDCTPWGLCADGKQKRTCTNTGTCNETESKPVEEMLCSTALFDLALKLKNIELTENKTLKFNVNLTEQRGAEKIDIYVKYSIINEEDYEIFSQIETKAVQGSLSYEKEIEETILVDGKYLLRVDAFYGYQQRALAEQKFEIKEGKLELAISKEDLFTKGLLIIYAFLIIIVILIVFTLTVLLIRRKKKRVERGGIGYKRKVKETLKRITSKKFLIILLGSMGIVFLFIAGKSLTGFVVNTSTIKSSSWSLFGFILVIGMLGLLAFLYRNKTKIFIEKTKERIKAKYPKNSIKGLMKKKVYTEEGEYIGDIKEIILRDNKIDSLIIELGKMVKKKNEIKYGGVIIKYNDVKSVGHIVIIKNRVLENLMGNHK